MRIPIGGLRTAGLAAIALAAVVTSWKDDADTSFDRREIDRLQAHFDSVLIELRARDVSALGPRQRWARAHLIRTLEVYRDAAVFPHNHDVSAGRVPYFRDAHGTLCAMAYLVAASGRMDIVDDVAAERNNAYIPDLASDLRLGAWLDSVGLTAAEAARIQPAYRPRSPLAVVEDHDASRYVAPSLALGVPALVSTILNWRAAREKKTDAALVVGALSGAATAILGGSMLADDRRGDMGRLGVADAVVGSAAIAVAVRRSLRRARGVPRRPPVAASEFRMSVDLVPVRGVSGVSSVGRVQIRF
jgi:hypothetical protein